MGLKVDRNQNDYVIYATSLENHHADYLLVKTMRASVLVLGPKLARYGVASTATMTHATQVMRQFLLVA
jgi:UDP-N-acetylglucosamine 1-carboxyvinyltransferase